MDGLGCVLNIPQCVDGGIAGIIAWFPFGIEGIKAAVWMVVGAALGKWGVGAVFVLAGALKVSGKIDHEHVDGPDAAPPPPVPKKKRKLF